MANDALTQNAAYSGALEACCQASTPGTGVTAAAIAQCLAFAQEFDTLLHANGASVASASRGYMTLAIVRGLFSGSNPGNLAINGGPNPALAASWATVAATAVACYATAVADLA
jgi:hypothetical protein